MKYKNVIKIFSILLILFLMPTLFAADQERIYGSELMTLEERNEHRAKLREMKTEEEREAYRIEHHQTMQERAKEQGKVLPDEPLQKGSGKRLSNTSKKKMGSGKGRY